MFESNVRRKIRIGNVVCVWIRGLWREEKWAMCSYEWNNNGQSAVKLLEMHVNKCCVLIVRQDYSEEIKH